MKSRIGVVLSGCGIYDGSEIHETTLALLAIDRHGAEAVCMAPDIALQEVDHLAGHPTGARRNALVESARIARGNIKNVAEIDTNDLDAIILPGGFGAATNLCDFTDKGANANVHPEVSRLLRGMAEQNKPIGAICIAPVVLAIALGNAYAPVLTVGNDSVIAGAIAAMGGSHLLCAADEVLIDEKNKIVTTPGYMLAERITEVSEGVGKTVKALIDMIRIS